MISFNYRKNINSFNTKIYDIDGCITDAGIISEIISV